MNRDGLDGLMQSWFGLDRELGLLELVKTGWEGQDRQCKDLARLYKNGGARLSRTVSCWAGLGRAELSRVRVQDRPGQCVAVLGMAGLVERAGQN